MKRSYTCLQITKILLFGRSSPALENGRQFPPFFSDLGFEQCHRTQKPKSNLIRTSLFVHSYHRVKDERYFQKEVPLVLL